MMPALPPILPALNYIGENFTRASGLKNLRMCHISETHLRRIFQESMRMPPVEYIKSVDPGKCKELRKTNASVATLHCTADSQQYPLNVIFERFSAFRPSNGGGHRNITSRIC